MESNTLGDNYKLSEKDKAALQMPLSRGQDSLEIVLLIDTTKIISEYDYSIRFEDDGSSDPQSFKAFYVLVVNVTKDTLSMGYGNQLPIVMEAFDKQGEWRQIEKPFVYMCGTGLNGIVLPPNEFVMTSTRISKGNFKTKLRLRYKKIVSPEFSGAINISQFESEWNKNGERKLLPKE